MDTQNIPALQYIAKRVDQIKPGYRIWFSPELLCDAYCDIESAAKSIKEMGCTLFEFDNGFGLMSIYRPR